MHSLTPSSTIQWVSRQILYPHPINADIYGSNEDVSDLVELIELSNEVRPLIVTATGKIISGHRRWRATGLLGWEQVPVEVKEFASAEAELWTLLAENAHRRKTSEQQIREGIHWEPLIKAQKAQNSLSNLKQNQELISERDNCHTRQKGRSSSRIASLVGCSSGRTYDRGAMVVKAADALKTEHPVLAEVWLNILNNQSVSAAHQLLRHPRRRQILEVIASGEAKTPKEALLKLSELSPKHKQIESTEHLDENLVGSWVIVKLKWLESAPEKKWNNLWGQVTAVKLALTVDVGTEELILHPQDVEFIDNPTPSFCEFALRILQLQKLSTLDELGKKVLNQLQQQLTFTPKQLSYLNMIEQIELAHHSVEQALS